MQRVLREETLSQLQNDGTTTERNIQQQIQRIIETDPTVITHLQRTIGNQRVIQLLRDNNTIQPTLKKGDAKTIQRGRTRNRILGKMFGFGGNKKKKKKSSGSGSGSTSKTSSPAPKEKKERTSEPGMYRAEPGVVRAAGAMTFFEIPTTFKKATASGGRYLISERGAGVNPLVLLGTPTEIKAWLNEHASMQIANTIADFDDDDPWNPSPSENPTQINMKITRTKGLVPVTRENVRSLTPVHDATQNIAEFVVGMGGGALGGLGGEGNKIGTVLNDGAGILSDIKSHYDWIQEKSGKGSKGSGDMEPMYVVQFSIYGGKEIANRDTHGVDTGKKDGADRAVRETVISFGKISGEILSGLS